MKLIQDRQHNYSLLLLAISIVVLFIFYSDLLLSPNSYFFGPADADSLKNYFTFSYYLKYDSGFMFSGMNYPYGEVNIFTDNQPIVSYTLNLIDDYVVSISDFGVGIINYFIFLSIVLAIQIMYRVLRRFEVGHIWAIVSSLLIVFLSPQLERTVPHITLSYMVFIPAAWLLTLKILTGKVKPLHLILINLLVFIATFIHIYYFFILLSLIWSIAVFDLFFSSKKWQNNLILIGSTLVTALAIVIIIKAIDQVNDRPEQPWGVDFYKSYFSLIFLPQIPPLLHELQPVFNYRRYPFEGISYVGLLGIPTLFYLLFKLGSNLIKKSRIKFFTDNQLNASIVGGFIILAVGMGKVHDIIPDSLLDLITPLKQIRSLGRFSWAFFYVFTAVIAISSWKIFYHLYTVGKKNGAWIFAGVVLLFGFFDSFFNVSYVSSFSGHRNRILIEDQSFPRNKVNSRNFNIDDYQAIMVLPYVHVGSEKFSKITHGPVMNAAFEWSYKTGLPILNVMMSRTSLSQSLKNLQLLGSDYIEKPILKDLNAKSLLLITKGEVTLEQEKRLIDAANQLWASGDTAVYHLPIDVFGDRMNEFKAEYKTLEDELIEIKPGVFAKEQTPNVVSFSFDDQFSEETFLGDGAFSLEQLPDTIGFSLPILTPDLVYEISFWVHLDHTLMGVPSAEMHVSGQGRNEVIPFSIHEENDIYGNWLRMSSTFKQTDSEDEYHLIFKNLPGTIDEVMVRPDSVDIYGVNGQKVMINNYVLE